MAERDKLEQELRFLSESLEAGVITQDEFNKGKERIENSIRELDSSSSEDNQPEESVNEGIKEEEPIESEEKQEEVTETKEDEKEDSIEEKKVNEEIIVEKKVDEEIEEKKEESTEKQPEVVVIKKEDKDSEDTLPVKEDEEPQTKLVEEEPIVIEKEKEPEKKKSRKMLWFIIILIALYIFVPNMVVPRPEYEGNDVLEQIEVQSQGKSSIIKALVTLEDGKVVDVKVTQNDEEKGFALENETFLSQFIGKSVDQIKLKSEGGEIDAVTGATQTSKGLIDAVRSAFNQDAEEVIEEPKEVVDATLTVINDKDCEICDTSRMEDTLSQLFNGINTEYLEFSDPKAKKLVNDLEIDAIPAYIIDNGIEESSNFEDFNRALIKVDEHYLVSKTAAGSNLFLNRDKVKNSLILYSISNTEMESEINELVELFGENIEFERVIVDESVKKQLKDELAITSYPTFLINNQIKFSGIRSADSIKEEYCNWNNIDECDEELSKSIN